MTNETATFANAAEEVEKMTTDERQEWLKSGDLPSDKPAGTLAEKPPEKKETPAEEPEQSRFEKPAPKEKKPTQMGYGELRARVADLEAQLASRTAREPEALPVPKVEAKPPDKERAKPTPSDNDDKGQAKYATYEDYLEDLADWKVEQRIVKLEKETIEKDAKAAVERDQRAISDKWKEQVDSARSKHADFMEVALDPKLPIPQGSAVEQWVLDSDIGTEILYHLAKHPDELKAIHAMPPVKAARALTILEAELSDSPAPPPEPAPASAAKRVTSAPPPAHEVGNRQRAPDYDPVAEALAEGNFEAYRRAENAKEIKSRKG